MTTDQQQPLRIQAVITSMACGGAERQMAIVTGGLAARGHQVSLAVLHGRSSFFSVHPAVSLRFFERERRPWGGRLLRFAVRPRWLRAVIGEHRADVVVSFIDVANVNTLLASRTIDAPVVVAERTYPPMHRLRWIEAWLRRWLYPRAAAVVVQTERAARWVSDCGFARRIVVISNPVPKPDRVGSDSGIALPDGPAVVAMGRLAGSKRFDLLLDAFARIAPRHPQWHLVILGEGPERVKLERRVRRLGLGSRVMLPGAVAHPESVLAACQLFVLTSDYEGFPNALCEAMALGLPVVATDCPVGVREVVRHEVDGLLVEPGNLDAVARAMERLVGDRAERTRMGGAAAEITRRFDVRSLLDRWEVLLRSLIEEGRA